MVVYVDVLVLENFIVNLFLLLMTFKILKLGYNRLIYLSAAIGAIYTICFFMENEILISLPAKTLVATVMVLISIKLKNYINVFKSVVCFFTTSMLLAGMCFYISINKGNYEIFQGFNLSSFSIKYVIVFLMILYIVIVRLTDYVKERNVISNLLYDVEIEINNKMIKLTGFLDTGNELREPVTNLPCIIVENSILDDVKIAKDKLYYINYSTINEVSKIEGFKSEKVTLKNSKSECKTIQAIICTCSRKLSSTNEFNALLSRGIL